MKINDTTELTVAWRKAIHNLYNAVTPIIAFCKSSSWSQTFETEELFKAHAAITDLYTQVPSIPEAIDGFKTHTFTEAEQKIALEYADNMLVAASSCEPFKKIDDSTKELIARAVLLGLLHHRMFGDVE